MTSADRFEPLDDEAATRWARFAKSETVLHPMLLGLEVEETRVDEDVVAEGWVTRRGRSVVFCESEAVGATSRRLVAKSVLTYNVSPGT